MRGEHSPNRVTLFVIVNGLARQLISAGVGRTDPQGDSRREDDRTSGPIILLSEQDERIESGDVVAPTDEQGFERSSGEDSCTGDDRCGDNGTNRLDEGLRVPRSHAGWYHGAFGASDLWKTPLLLAPSSGSVLKLPAVPVPSAWHQLGLRPGPLAASSLADLSIAVGVVHVLVQRADGRP